MTRKAVWSAAIVAALLSFAIGSFLIIHPSPEMSPTLSPEKQQLFGFVMSCPLTGSWELDFEGSHSPYTGERRRCTREQLKAAAVERAVRLSRQLDFLLIEQHKLFHRAIVAGWDCDGECPAIRQLRLSGRPVLLLTTVAWGSSGNGQWCFLGWMGDYIGCWHLPDEVTHAERHLAPDEMLGHGLYPKVEGDKVVFVGPIGDQHEGNCCPTHGELHIELTPADGDFEVDRIYRTPPSQSVPTTPRRLH